MTAKPAKPNLLFVFSDQHRAAATGCYGEKQIATPHMDSLARDGLRLDNCVSTHPVCCPYRASLITGRFAHHTGMLSNYIDIGHDYVGLGEAFKRGGYATGYVGKWHIYFAGQEHEGNNCHVPPGPYRMGFDWWAASNGGHNYYKWFYWRDDPARIDGREYQPFEQVDRCKQFIDSRKDQADPWCLVLSWGPPHTPYKPPPGFDGPRDIVLRGNVPAGKAAEYAANVTPKYYGLTESLDVALGRLLEHLDATGQRENTVVVYTSDHGDMLGCQGLKFKRWPQDESVNVPFLIRWPKGLPAGGASTLHLGTPDLYPTLCGLCGVDVPTRVDGRDLSAYLRDPQKSGAPSHAYASMAYAYTPWPGWKMVRSDEHVYVEKAGEPWMLYERRNDPLQRVNLVGQRRAAQNELRAMLNESMAACGDAWEHATQRGDWEYWQPGSKKYAEQDLGGMETLGLKR